MNKKKFSSQLGYKVASYGTHIPHVVVGILQKTRKKKDDIYLNVTNKKSALESAPPYPLQMEVEVGGVNDHD